MPRALVLCGDFLSRSKQTLTSIPKFILSVCLVVCSGRESLEFSELMTSCPLLLVSPESHSSLVLGLECGPSRQVAPCLPDSLGHRRDMG